MPFTNAFFDNFVAQDYSKFTECAAPDRSATLTRAESWLTHFILASSFNFQVNPRVRPHVFGILRRALAAISEYESGREAVMQFLEAPREFLPAYFRALAHFEFSVAATYQTYVYVMKITKTPLYQSGDASPLDRLNRIYNVSKHLEETSLTDTQLHAVWMTNEGICCSTSTVTWGELGEFMDDVAQLATNIVDPPKEAIKSAPV